MNSALQRIAAIAKDLKQSELRILIELAQRAETTASDDITASTRDLAQATGLDRKHIRKALQALEERGIVSSDKGSATRAATHSLLGQTTVPLKPAGPGGLKHPPPGGLKHPPWEQKAPTPGGLRHPPPPAAIDAGARTHTFGTLLDFDFDIDRSIDRLQKASKTDYDPVTFATARDRIHGYQVKFGNPAAAPPDDTIVSQFLAVAEWQRLEAMLYDLMADRRKPGTSYAWYVTVALQRMTGATPGEIKARRDAASNSQRFNKPPGHEQLRNAIATAAAGKAMR